MPVFVSEIGWMSRSDFLRTSLVLVRSEFVGWFEKKISRFEKALRKDVKKSNEMKIKQSGTVGVLLVRDQRGSVVGEDWC